MDQEEMWPMRMVTWEQESYSENLHQGMIYGTPEDKIPLPSSSTTVGLGQGLPHLC